LKLQQARVKAQAPPVKLPKQLPLNVVGVILEVSPVEIARQLTLVDWDIFSLIKAVEFLDVAWTSSKLKYRAENILRMINVFNLRSNWVGRIILKQKSFRFRVKCYEKIIEVAKELIALHNFSSALAVISGLSNAAVYRLKHTKAAVKKELMAAQTEISNYLDPSFSNRNYRQALSAMVPPTIPHLGVFLSDLVFIEEGNPDVLHTNLINFRKRQLTFGVISLIQGYQLQGYALRPVSTIQNLLHPGQATDDDTMFKWSLAVEPRDFTPPK